MKYPFTSMVIGQIVLNQPIEIELWEKFQEEYFYYTREISDEDKKEISYLTPYGNLDFAHFMPWLSGCGESVNNVGRWDVLCELETSINELFSRPNGGSENFPVLDTEYPIDEAKYLRGKPFTFRWGSKYSKETI